MNKIGHETKGDNSPINGDITIRDMEKNNRRKSPSKYAVILLIIIGGIFLFWALAILSHVCFGFSIIPTDIILTFVGAIATFIVISNYLQIHETENKFEQKVEEMKLSFDEKTEELKSSFDEKISKQKNELNAYLAEIYFSFALHGV